MASLPTKFLSLIPTLHKSAIVTEDGSAISSQPTSPEVKPFEPVEKTRRSSSSASAMSMPGDAAKDVTGMQFLKLGN